MIQLMKNLGIIDDDSEVDGVNVDVSSNNSSSSGIGRINYNEFSTFVRDIYLTCKNLGVTLAEHWKLLINKLKKYGDIKVAIKEQQENHDKLQKEVNYLNKQKQQTSAYLQIAISFINAINSKIYYYKEFMGHYKDLNNKINLSSRFSHPFIIIIYKDAGKDKDNNNKENKENKNE